MSTQFLDYSSLLMFYILYGVIIVYHIISIWGFSERSEGREAWFKKQKSFGPVQSAVATE